ncbi:MAG: hypothetical protein KDI88_03935 [Gammaproteobacteria bacterium]|nr:hypothetical protein [Gammaproteobacteria bacterium]
MRTLFRLILLLLFVGLLFVGSALYFGLADEPLVDSRRTLSHQDIARAKSVLKQNDPRGLPAGSRRTIAIARGDLDLAAHYLAQKVVNGQAQVALGNDRVGVRVTVPVPLLPARNFLNVDLVVRTPGGQPELESFRLGSLHLPAPLVSAATHLLLDTFYGEQQLARLMGAIEAVRILPHEMQLTYEWNPGLIDQARDTLLASADREALGYYLDELVRLQSTGIGSRGKLVDLLQPLFAAAADRSRTGDPMAENIALLTVLGTWSSGQNTSRLVPNAGRPRAYRLKLAGRRDFGQHFLTSAALAARGDSSLSDAVGLFKEIADSDGGSGFSFTDIAADRAGTRFGEVATRSHDSAVRLQRLAAAGLRDEQLMPSVSDLPEHLDGATFRHRYGEVGSPAYRQVMDDIERRIEGIELYRH